MPQFISLDGNIQHGNDAKTVRCITEQIPFMTGTPEHYEMQTLHYKYAEYISLKMKAQFYTLKGIYY